MKKLITLCFTVFICLSFAKSQTKLYLYPSTDWLSSGATFGAIFKNGDIDTGTNVMFTVSNSTTHLYELDVPTGTWTQIRLNRYAPDGVSNWGGYTYDIPYDGTKNCITVVGWASSHILSTYPPQPIRIKFKKPATWENVNIHAWDAMGVKIFAADWPGMAMSAEADDWYSYQVEYFQGFGLNVNNVSNTIVLAGGGVVANTCYQATSSSTAEVCDCPAPSIMKSSVFVGDTPASANWYNAQSTDRSSDFNGTNLGAVSVLKIGANLTIKSMLDNAGTLNYTIDNSSAKSISLNRASTDLVGGDVFQISSGVNVLDGLTLSNGSHTIAVWFTSSVDDVTDIDDNTGSKYIATFDINNTPTEVQSTEIIKSVFVSDKQLHAAFIGTAKVEIYTPTGQLIYVGFAKEQFSYAIQQSGIYLLRINGEPRKIIVP